MKITILDFGQALYDNIFCKLSRRGSLATASNDRYFIAKNFVSLLKDKRSLYPTVTNKCRSNFYGQF